jgi:hypothetical protein
MCQHIDEAAKMAARVRSDMHDFVPFAMAAPTKRALLPLPM